MSGLFLWQQDTGLSLTFLQNHYILGAKAELREITKVSRLKDYSEYPRKTLSRKQ